MFVCFPLDSIMECKDGCKQYQFTSFAKHTIGTTFKDFIRKKEPAILILATCYSEKSDVNKLLWEYGHYAALNISADRGQLTDGRIYELDGDQSIVLEKVHKDHVQARTSGEIKETKNVVLMGHAGTGELEKFLTPFNLDTLV